MAGQEERKERVRSLRELPQEIAPARELWPGIEAQLRAEMRSAGASDGTDTRRRFGLQRLALGLAATVAAVAIGIWIGRGQLPVPGNARVTPPPAAQGGMAQTTPIGRVTDPRYTQQRAELLKALDARLEQLPPESRTKVTESLETIESSKRILEAELGRDPSNALLQELLVNTYQDEMRVLTTVYEAGSAGGGI